jgi:hypothetical protein
MRTVLIRGPLTADEILDIIAVMQRIEAARPTETFHVAVDAPEADDQIERIMDQVPLNPGYERITRTVRRDAR